MDGRVKQDSTRLAYLVKYKLKKMVVSTYAHPLPIQVVEQVR